MAVPAAPMGPGLAQNAVLTLAGLTVAFQQFAQRFDQLAERVDGVGRAVIEIGGRVGHLALNAEANTRELTSLKEIQGINQDSLSTLRAGIKGARGELTQIIKFFSKKSSADKAREWTSWAIGKFNPLSLFSTAANSGGVLSGIINTYVHAKICFGVIPKYIGQAAHYAASFTPLTASIAQGIQDGVCSLPYTNWLCASIGESTTNDLVSVGAEVVQESGKAVIRTGQDAFASLQEGANQKITDLIKGAEQEFKGLFSTITTPSNQPYNPAIHGIYDQNGQSRVNPNPGIGTAHLPRGNDTESDLGAVIMLVGGFALMTIIGSQIARFFQSAPKPVANTEKEVEHDK